MSTFEEAIKSLSSEEPERIYLEGKRDYVAGKQFHESPYPNSIDADNDEEYARGYHWRRGWNDASLANSPPLLCPACQRKMESNGQTVWCPTEGCAFNQFKPE
jgi:hypothetical protein